MSSYVRIHLFILAAASLSCGFTSEGSTAGSSTTGAESESSGDATTSPATTSASSTSDTPATTGSSSGASTSSSSGTSGSMTTTSAAGSTGDTSTGETSDTDPGPCCDPIIEGVPCTEDCEHDFSGIEQLYCTNTCSPVPPDGCQQGDADLLCRLRMRSPTAYAESFEVVAVVDAPGFCCFGFEGPDAVALGPWPAWGVTDSLCFDPVSIEYLGGNAVQNVVCKDDG